MARPTTATLTSTGSRHLPARLGESSGRLQRRKNHVGVDVEQHLPLMGKRLFHAPGNHVLFPIDFPSLYELISEGWPPLAGMFRTVIGLCD